MLAKRYQECQEFYSMTLPPDDPVWLSWAKTPQNGEKMAEFLKNYGHPKMKGKYRYGWPEGIIYHHTAGRSNPYGTVK